jgi:hypothetical protein
MCLCTREAGTTRKSPPPGAALQWETLLIGLETVK